jgi:hypothetical protein
MIKPVKNKRIRKEYISKFGNYFSLTMLILALLWGGRNHKLSAKLLLLGRDKKRIVRR